MNTVISLNSSILERVVKWLCLLHGKKNCDSIDYVRLQIILDKYKQLSKNGIENGTILKLKKLDGSSWQIINQFIIITFDILEVYSEPCQTSKTGCFAKLLNVF